MAPPHWDSRIMECEAAFHRECDISQNQKPLLGKVTKTPRLFVIAPGTSYLTHTVSQVSKFEFRAKIMGHQKKKKKGKKRDDLLFCD